MELLMVRVSFGVDWLNLYIGTIRGCSETCAQPSPGPATPNPTQRAELHIFIGDHELSTCFKV